MIRMSRLICRHEWSYNFPSTLSELITLDETLIQLAFALTSGKRICKKCGKAEIYEPPWVCGGSKWKWCDADNFQNYAEGENDSED